LPSTARDTKLGRDVAIKVLPPSFVRDPDRLARLTREARLLASLNHPHIATIHGLEEADGVRALVMELVEGPTLAEKLAQGARRNVKAGLPLADVLKIGGQIAEALEAAHENGVIHRDLKPTNIKLSHDGHVKVLDFSLAKAFSSDGTGSDLSHLPTITATDLQAGAIVGTPAYMSPEQARGRAIDKRTDIWGFGSVLYEMDRACRVPGRDDLGHDCGDSRAGATVGGAADAHAGGDSTAVAAVSGQRSEPPTARHRRRADRNRRRAKCTSCRR
jgi:serine/threonine protein kinase